MGPGLQRPNQAAADRAAGLFPASNGPSIVAQWTDPEQAATRTTRSKGLRWHTGLEMVFDAAENAVRVSRLQRKGVEAWGPERVYLHDDVDLNSIEPGAVLHNATLSGPSLRIAAGAIIGASGHAEVNDCQVGRNVELGAGLYHGATFLSGAKVRGFAEIRPSTLLEEQAEVAQNVGLKNTTFTSCCVAGSMINLCDLFLTGGTSRQDHTEVGSGVVHYNFDPRGDKWGSLIGTIRGLLLRSAPVFIGGSCGLVAPLEIGLGAVTAAGSVIRKDVGEGELVAAAGRRVRKRGFDRTSYGPLKRQFLVTAKLVATLRALDRWYEQIRVPCARSGEKPFLEAARLRIEDQASERVRRLGKVVDKLSAGSAPPASGAPLAAEHARLIDGWERLRAVLASRPQDEGPPPGLVDAYGEARIGGHGHVEAVQSLGDRAADAEAWLERLVDRLTAAAAASLG